MKKKIDSENIHVSDFDWHIGHFHFSFANYSDPKNGPFGVLEALNDFQLDPNAGFETHPHDEMEILSYCLEGALDHKDSVGIKNTIKRGDVQYLCAGSGITHSEMNSSINSPLRFIQIWITPNKKGLSPIYRSMKFPKNIHKNKLRLIASGEKHNSVITIQQDVNIYIAELEKYKHVPILNHDNRKSYIVCLEGSLIGKEVSLIKGDALKLWGKESFSFTAEKDSHLLMVEMSLEN